MPMNLPDLYEENSSSVKTDVFLGLNRAPRIGDGEFHDMQNLTSDEFPVLAVRARRERRFPLTFPSMIPPTDPSSLFSASPSHRGNMEVLCFDTYRDGTGGRLYYGLLVNNSLVELGLDSVENRRIVRMGAYAIVLPDMVYVNTVNTTDFGPIKDEYVPQAGLYTYISVVDSDGESPEYMSDTRPTGDVENGALWHQTVKEGTTGTPGLYRYNEEEGKWKEEISYIEVEIQNLPLGWAPLESNFLAQPLTFKSPLAAGQAIRIQGIHEAVDGDRVIQAVRERRTNQKEIVAFTVQGIISTGGVRKDITESDPVSIERPIPQLDFACEIGNRLWGCRYENTGGEDINEIYCCARGDFYRWIQGAADDPDAPVTFSIGSDGAWTGVICYRGYPTFFKENTMYQLSGTGASGYSMHETKCVGVGNGFDKSLAVVGNVLYYKSVGPVMAFDGSAPVPVSEKLGRLTGYTHAAGGACGEKYYLCLWKDGNTPDAVLYVLDTARGIWYKEDDACVESMASVGDCLYMSVVNKAAVTVNIGAAGEYTYTPNKIINVVGGDEGAYMEGPVRWYAETGVIGMESDAAKYLSKIMVRLSMDVGSTVRISVQYDSMGTFKQLTAVEADRMKVVTLPILPVRCDHLRLRLEGVGGCRLFSLTKVFETSEDL